MMTDAEFEGHVEALRRMHRQLTAVTLERDHFKHLCTSDGGPAGAQRDAAVRSCTASIQALTKTTQQLREVLITLKYLFAQTAHEAGSVCVCSERLARFAEETEHEPQCQALRLLQQANLQGLDDPIPGLQQALLKLVHVVALRVYNERRVQR